MDGTVRQIKPAESEDPVSDAPQTCAAFEHEYQAIVDERIEKGSMLSAITKIKKTYVLFCSKCGHSRPLK